MGKRYIEKESAKYNHGLIEKPSNKLKRKWDRHNFEVGYLRNEKNKLKYKYHESISENQQVV